MNLRFRYAPRLFYASAKARQAHRWFNFIFYVQTLFYSLEAVNLTVSLMAM